MDVSHILQEIAARSFDIGSSCWVDVTYIINPHHFYVRPRAYNMHLPMLQARQDRFKASEINVGDVVIFKSRTQKEHVRGRVLSKQVEGTEPKFTLFAIDVGCTEDSVHLKKIWKRKYECSVPSLVTACCLAECGPLGEKWQDDIADIMWNYVKDERARMLVKNVTADKLVVELYNTCPDDIATMLALTGFTTLGFVHNSQSD